MRVGRRCGSTAIAIVMSASTHGRLELAILCWTNVLGLGCTVLLIAHTHYKHQPPHPQPFFSPALQAHVQLQPVPGLPVQPLADPPGKTVSRRSTIVHACACGCCSNLSHQAHPHCWANVPLMFLSRCRCGMRCRAGWAPSTKPRSSTGACRGPHHANPASPAGRSCVWLPSANQLSCGYG